MDKLLDFINVSIVPSAFAMDRTSQLRAFEEKSIRIFRYFPHVVHQFQWFGLETMEERASALQHLGYMLLRMLKQMREVYDIRTQQLCDEHCDMYEKWIREIDNRMRSIGDFADKAENVLNNEAYIESHRKNLLEQLITMREQMGDLVNLHKDTLVNRCNELNLRYDSENLSYVLIGARGFFYQVLNFIALLTVPSHKKEPEQAFVDLFQRSFTRYRESATGRSIQETFADKLADEIAYMEEKQQLDVMRNSKKSLGAEISEYLKRFGVEYCGIKNNSVGKLCRQLYECLNKPCASGGTKGKEPDNETEAKTKKMTNQELQEYFHKEVQMQYLNQKISELREAVEQKKSLANREKPSKQKVAAEKKKSRPGMFIVDENKLAVCFAKLYNGYLGADKDFLLVGNPDESLFFAYLFLLVEMERLGKEGFADNSRKPFFEFIKAKVLSGKTEKTMRTFHNRVDSLQNLREQLLAHGVDLSENSLWKDNSDYKNFHRICDKFHQSHYFKGLEAWKKR